MPTSRNSTTFTVSSDREVVLTHVFDAPRELVWQAYTDPKQVPKWWGPRRLTTKVDKMDVRPGGVWRFVQRGPDGAEFAFNGVYREVVRPHRIVDTFEFEGMAGHIMVETVTFEEDGGRTKVTVRSQFDTKEERDGMVASGMEKGAVESMERFDELLKEMSS